LSLSRASGCTTPGDSPLKSGASVCPKPKRRAKRAIRSAPTCRPALIEPTLLDLTMTSSKVSTP
jgi:hypothetical protein